MALGVLAVALTWLLQPAALMTLPFAMLVLGASRRPDVDASIDDGARRGDDERHAGDVSPVPSVVWAVAVGLGLVAAGYLATAEVRMWNGVTTADSAEVAAAASMYVRDPIATHLAATSYLADQSLDPAAGLTGLELLERSVEYDPHRPLWWTSLSNQQGVLGDLDGALASARRAVELQPTDVRAWELIRQVGLDQDDLQLVDESEAALCRFGYESVC